MTGELHVLKAVAGGRDIIMKDAIDVAERCGAFIICNFNAAERVLGVHSQTHNKLLVAAICSS